MKPKFRVLLEMSIDEGVRTGFFRAHKHVEDPSPEAVIESIQEHVMSKMYEYFIFEEDI